MREVLRQILALQTRWSSENTPEMTLRGKLIRDTLPAWMSERIVEALKTLPVHFQDIAAEGRDGTGLKSQIPWARAYSKGRSPSATEGWYLVYLFGADGGQAYLSLNQGTTQWDRGEFKPRPVGEIRARADWARSAIALETAKWKGLTTEIQLHSTTSLGVAYGIGNVVAIEYSANNLPNEEQLRQDFDRLLNLLVLLYEDEENALLVPGGLAPEVVDALSMADLAAGSRRKHGRNRLTGAERKAIEQHAVDVTTEYLLAAGFSVSDVGATQSYDLDARRDGQRIYVEVKGTVSSGEEVILTRNEVALHQKNPSQSMLSIVSEIVLDRTGMVPIASSGTLRVTTPWVVQREALTPLTYLYQVPADT